MRALVVGGSSGIGLSIILNLIDRVEYDRVYVLDKLDFPSQYKTEKVTSAICDLSSGVFSILEGIDCIDALYITAGFGHLRFFQELDGAYIQNCFEVNAIAPVQIIRLFKEKQGDG